MRILVTGATGFIGSALIDGLLLRGHALVVCIHARNERRWSDRVSYIAVDFMCDTDEAVWIPRLDGVDAVVNAVGILRESADADFKRLHTDAPVALFRACEMVGVERCIQISALGANAEALSAYHRSKHSADEALRVTSLAWTIVQPSLVIGMQSGSTRLFATLASMPLMPLVGRGHQLVQPVRIADLVELIIGLLEKGVGVHETVVAVGPRALMLRELLQGLRENMGLPRTLFLNVPIPVIRLAAKFGDCVGHGALSGETLSMLMQGNTAPTEQTCSVLGRPPRYALGFAANNDSVALRTRALDSWLRPTMHFVLAMMWITAGIVSWVYAKELGLELLGKLGIPDVLTLPVFIASCGFNLVLGVLSLFHPSRRLWMVQLFVVLFYTLALTLVSPTLWHDPFGALVKNLPIMVVLIGLMQFEPER